MKAEMSEVDAMAECAVILSWFDQKARERMLRWMTDHFRWADERERATREAAQEEAARFAAEAQGAV